MCPITEKKKKVETAASIKSGDENFIPLYGIRLKAGRNLLPGDSVTEVIINETLAKKLGIMKAEEAIGESISIGNRSFPVVGVVEDFHEQSFHEPIGATIICNMTREQHAIALKLGDDEKSRLAEVISNVEREFKSLYPDEPFDYHFIEDEIGWMHDKEKKMSSLATIAMTITIFISCMGVFGLAMFTSELKTKEIGIRKVLGASALNITTMLNREFVVLIIIAILIASPVAWYFMNNWLMEFSYRTELSLWIFIVSGITGIFIGLITVSFQSLKAALADPVKSLRSE